MTKFYQSDDTQRGPARVCIIASPGVGKTRLAGTFYKPYILDTDLGAGSLRAPRMTITERPMETILAELKKLTQSPVQADGTVTYSPREGIKPFSVGTVVVDSFDVVQVAKKIEMLGTKTKMEQGDWDRILNVMLPLLQVMKGLPIDLVVTSHVRQEEGEGDRPGLRTFAVQGALKTILPGEFGLILHMEALQGGKRVAYVNPAVVNGYQVVAKDRHAIFGAGTLKIDIPTQNGLPTDEIAKKIRAYHWGTEASDVRP